MSIFKLVKEDRMITFGIPRMQELKNIPVIKEISVLELPEIISSRMSNDIPVHQINLGTQEVLKLEFAFNAGRPYETTELAARTTLRMLKEGTENFSSAQIAETLDFYGGSLTTPFNLDVANITMHCLTRQFDNLLPMLSDIILNPTFPQNELDTFIRKSKSKLKVDLLRSDVVAYRTITELVFGSDHVYGYNSFAEAYDNLSVDQLKNHFTKNYVSGNCNVFVSGKWHGDLLSKIDQEILQKIPIGKSESIAKDVEDRTPERKIIKIPNNLQASIRIGCRLFNRQHPDFKKMVIVSTILGGYFGSRLMTNIREEKGYTYNIFATIDTFRNDGLFYIGAEVAMNFIEETIKEIYQEINKLQNELISNEELQMVRNYMLGNLLNMLDGPFNVSELIRTMEMDQLKKTDFELLVQTIKTISANDIQELSRKYLVKEKMWEVVVN